MRSCRSSSSAFVNGSVGVERRGGAGLGVVLVGAGELAGVGLAVGGVPVGGGGGAAGGLGAAGDGFDVVVVVVGVVAQVGGGGAGGVLGQALPTGGVGVGLVQSSAAVGLCTASPPFAMPPAAIGGPPDPGGAVAVLPLTWLWLSTRWLVPGGMPPLPFPLAMPPPFSEVLPLTWLLLRATVPAFRFRRSGLLPGNGCRSR